MFLEIHVVYVSSNQLILEVELGVLRTCMCVYPLYEGQTNLGGQMHMTHWRKIKEALICFYIGSIWLPRNCKCRFIGASEVNPGDWLQHLGDT